MNPPKPSIVALIVIAVLSIVLGCVFSPSDPYSFVIQSCVLLSMSLGSYFAGLKRGCQSSVA